MAKKNVAMSVRDRLLNIRQSEPDVSYMQILLRYIQERMLYRLSISQYRENLCLKGSALLFAYDKFKARQTKDIDFLGDKINRDKGTIKAAFSEICSCDVFRFHFMQIWNYTPEIHKISYAAISSAELF